MLSPSRGYAWNDSPARGLATSLAVTLLATTWTAAPLTLADDFPTQVPAAQLPPPVYQWIDASGMQHFSSEPPAAGSVEYREISGELGAFHIRVEQPPSPEVVADTEAQTPVVIGASDGEDSAMNAQRLRYCTDLAVQIDKLERHLQEEQRAEVIDRLVLTLHRYEERHRVECR